MKQKDEVISNENVIMFVYVIGTTLNYFTVIS